MLKQKFGFLRVIKITDRPTGTTQRCLFWRCRCVCGTEIDARGTALRSGHTTSCGCDGIDRTPMHNKDGSYSIAMSGGFNVIVDATDLALVTKYRWRAYTVKGRLASANIVYARTGVGKKRITMHRLLVGDAMVDHADGNGLNNRRSNLRKATVKQNSANSHKQRNQTSSHFKGVCWHKQANKWVVHVAGKHVGMFTDERKAAEAYNREAKKRWGKFARLNAV